MSMNTLKKLLKNSELKVWKQQLSSGKFPDFKPRALKDSEITALERNHNVCEDWSQVTVESAFDPSRIRNSTFGGQIVLPRFFGTVMTPGGVSVPTGIYHSAIYSSIVENAHICDMSLISKIVIRKGATLRNVGSLVCTGKTSFGCGEVLSVGTETGGRTIPLFPDLTMELAAEILMSKKDKIFQKDIWEAIEKFREEISSTMGYIGRDATVCNTSIVRNSWIGNHVRVDGAIKIRNSCLLSSMEQPTRVQDGAIVEDSMLQWGSVAANSALVKSSMLMEVCSAGKHALLSNAVIGPNTHVQESEVTSSLVGPFTGLHHHCLLISALWPEGCGNVGYGANIGSNHTGRLPDQEIRPGKGTFFGLSCNVKYPVNFQNAPYTLVSTGLTLLPQKMDFPFSLLKEPSHRNPLIPSLFNELIPAWNLEYNAYFLARNEKKFLSRNKARRQDFEFSLHEAGVVRTVLTAYRKLKEVSPVREFYFEREIPGIGKNYLSESVRQMALKAYEIYLERYLLEIGMTRLESESGLLARDNIDRKVFFPGELPKEVSRLITFPTSVPRLVKRYRDLEKRWLDSILLAMEKDFVRGAKIFDDYESVHDRTSYNYTFPTERFEKIRKRCNQILAVLRAR